MSTTDKVLGEIRDERQRQTADEGYSQEHDDEHDPGELAAAAASYALNAACVLHPLNGTPIDDPPHSWPWDPHEWKPKEPRRDLIRAAALIVAELEKLHRQPDALPDRYEIVEDGPERFVLIDKESDDPAPVYESREAAMRAAQSLALE